MAKKMTKKEMFAQILANYALTDAERDFVEHEIELLSNRNKSGGERKPTAKQVENTDLKTVILDFLTDHPDEKFTITDLWKKVPELANNPEMSNQRISSLVVQLKKENFVVREEIKRKAYFSINLED